MVVKSVRGSITSSMRRNRPRNVLSLYRDADSENGGTSLSLTGATATTTGAANAAGAPGAAAAAGAAVGAAGPLGIEANRL